MGVRREVIKINDMTCTSCEVRIEKVINALDGIAYVKASYVKCNVEIVYEESLCTLNQIKSSIEKAGYSTKDNGSIDKILGFALIAGAIIILGKFSTSYNVDNLLSNATYFMLFVVGLISSLHCVGMCGGIMLSQSITKQDTSNKLEAIKPALLYNSGRVASYTILGAVIGALGSVLSLSLKMKAGLEIFAGLFMIIMGLNMLGFKAFRKVHIRLPWSSCNVKQKSNTPFIVGLLNGLMPCGPLQTMGIFALGTGSALKGAISMFFFSIGTLPLMLTFGTVSGLLSKGYTKKILKFSGTLIILLGFIMGSRGMALTGINLSSVSALSYILPGSPIQDTKNSNHVNVALINDKTQLLQMTASSNGFSPTALVVQKDIPVKWVINVDQLTSCNNSIVVPAINIEKELIQGENTIEFTPTSSSDISFSCSMGILRGVIKVVDQTKNADTSKIADNAPPIGEPSYHSSGSNSSDLPSIYGDDLSIVPAERLVKKASVKDGVQILNIDGIGHEFDPLIAVFNRGINSHISLDLTAFDNLDTKFNVIDGSTGKIIYSFYGKKGENNITLKTNKTASYGISKDGTLLCIITIVDDIDIIDLGKIKQRYVK